MANGGHAERQTTNKCSATNHFGSLKGPSCQSLEYTISSQGHNYRPVVGKGNSQYGASGTPIPIAIATGSQWSLSSPQTRKLLQRTFMSFSTNPASFQWFYMSVLGELSHFGDVVREERRKLLRAHGGW